MDTRKQAALQIALSEISTVIGLRKSAERVLKGMGQFSYTGACCSTQDILFEENKVAFMFRRKGNK